MHKQTISPPPDFALLQTSPITASPTTPTTTRSGRIVKQPLRSGEAPVPIPSHRPQNGEGPLRIQADRHYHVGRKREEQQQQQQQLSDDTLSNMDIDEDAAFSPLPPSNSTPSIPLSPVPPTPPPSLNDNLFRAYGIWKAGDASPTKKALNLKLCNWVCLNKPDLHANLMKKLLAPLDTSASQEAQRKLQLLYSVRRFEIEEETISARKCPICTNVCLRRGFFMDEEIYNSKKR